MRQGLPEIGAHTIDLILVDSFLGSGANTRTAK